MPTSKKQYQNSYPEFVAQDNNLQKYIFLLLLFLQACVGHGAEQSVLRMKKRAKPQSHPECVSVATVPHSHQQPEDDCCTFPRLLGGMQAGSSETKQRRAEAASSPATPSALEALIARCKTGDAGQVEATLKTYLQDASHAEALEKQFEGLKYDVRKVLLKAMHSLAGNSTTYGAQNPFMRFVPLLLKVYQSDKAQQLVLPDLAQAALEALAKKAPDALITKLLPALEACAKTADSSARPFLETLRLVKNLGAGSDYTTSLGSQQQILAVLQRLYEIQTTRHAGRIKSTALEQDVLKAFCLVAQSAARGAGATFAQAQVDLLLRASTSADYKAELASGAATTLSHIATECDAKSMLPTLQSALKSGQAAARATIAEGLGTVLSTHPTLATPEAIAPLQNVAQDGKAPFQLRKAAVRALGKVGDKVERHREAIQALLKALAQDQDDRLRKVVQDVQALLDVPSARPSSFSIDASRVSVTVIMTRLADQAATKADQDKLSAELKALQAAFKTQMAAVKQAIVQGSVKDKEALQQQLAAAEQAIKTQSAQQREVLSSLTRSLEDTLLAKLDAQGGGLTGTLLEEALTGLDLDKKFDQISQTLKEVKNRLSDIDEGVEEIAVTIEDNHVVLVSRLDAVEGNVELKMEKMQAVFQASISQLSKKSEEGQIKTLESMKEEISKTKIDIATQVAESNEDLAKKLLAMFTEREEAFFKRVEQAVPVSASASGNYGAAFLKYQQKLLRVIETENKAGLSKQAQGDKQRDRGKYDRAAKRYEWAKGCYERAMEKIPDWLPAGTPLFEEVRRNLAATEAALQQVQEKL